MSVARITGLAAAGWFRWLGALALFSPHFGCSGDRLHVAENGGQRALDGATADATEDGAPPLRDVEDFVRVAMEFPTCGNAADCWRRFEVRAPSTLVLQDLAGEERFALEDRQYRAVLEVVSLPEFQAVMADVSSWTCPPGDHGDPTVTAEWKDVGIQEAQVADGCFGTPDDPQHLYEILREHMIYLKNKYMNCPLGGVLPPEVGGGSASRALCFACMGQC